MMFKKPERVARKFLNLLFVYMMLAQIFPDSEGAVQVGRRISYVDYAKRKYLLVDPKPCVKTTKIEQQRGVVDTITNEEIEIHVLIAKERDNWCIGEKCLREIPSVSKNNRIDYFSMNRLFLS